MSDYSPSNTETPKNESTFTVTVSDPNLLLTPKSSSKKWSRYKQSFRYEWLDNPNLRGWLAPDPNNDQRAKCKLCNKSLNAHKKDLLHHAATKAHSLRAASSEVTFETEDANITIISHDAENEDEAETIQIISEDPNPDQLPPTTAVETETLLQHSPAASQSLPPPSSQSPMSSSTQKPKRKYTKRKHKVKQEFGGTTKLAQHQSIQAVESLLGMDLTNTLRSFGDIEIHIPVDDDNDNNEEVDLYADPVDSFPKPKKKKFRSNANKKVLSTLSSSGHPMVKLTTDNCPISSVTVFKEKAQICRSLDTSVKFGTSEVRISGFFCVDSGSIKVESSRLTTLTDVSFQLKCDPADGHPMSEKEKVLSDTLKLLQEAKRTLDSETRIESLDRQYNVIDKFAEGAIMLGSSGTVPQVDSSFAQGMKKFLNRYREFGRQVEGEKMDIMKRRYELDKKIEQVQTNLEDLRSKTDESDLPWDCVIMLESEVDDAPVHLKISYVVYSAGWMPSYDFRMNPNDRLLKVSYFGMVTQNTGEPWENVKMTLSTATPGVGGHIPAPMQTSLSIAGTVGSTRSRYQAIALTTNSESNDESKDHTADASHLDSPVLQTQACTPSTSFDLPHQHTVPSDNSPHKVTLSILDFLPSLNYVTIPKIVPQVFLNAKVVNSSDLTLLPGKVSVFLDNSLVAKTTLKAVAPQEEFECSLGIAPEVKVIYKPLVKVNMMPGIISHEQTIDLHNLHTYPVNVTVKDNLPSSHSENVKVILEAPYIHPQHPDQSEALLTEDNTVVWDCALLGQDKETLLLKYTIEHPVGEHIHVMNV